MQFPPTRRIQTSGAYRLSSRVVLLVLAASVFIPLARIAHAQFQQPVDNVSMNAPSAFTWNSEAGETIVQLEGPVAIEMDHTKLTARTGAVVWLSDVRDGVVEQQRVEIVLLGDSTAAQGGNVRSGPNMVVTAIARGAIRVTADNRLTRDLSESETYRKATALRPRQQSGFGPGPQILGGITPQQQQLRAATTAPVTGSQIRALTPVTGQAKFVQTIQSAEKRIVAVMSGGVLLIYRDKDGGTLEFQADKAVLFTTLTSIGEAQTAAQVRKVQEAAEAIYIEGDARIGYTPGGNRAGEQRLSANRAYYELATDRAILTDAVLHTVEPSRQIPVFMRALSIRMLAKSEYNAEQVQLTTSGFATPSLSLAADRAYVRQMPADDPELGTLTTFEAHDATVNMWGVPVLYFPVAGGTVTEQGLPLRQLQVGNSQRFGTSVQTEWGLFESLGKPRPRDLDASYRLDYYGDRGPGGGIDADYGGGYVTETTKEPWNFRGDFKSFFIMDRGKDELGGLRPDTDPETDFRGHMLWQHQHFFPDHWQMQVRAGFVSDPTFLEQWDEKDWNSNNPHNTSLYLKRQENTEALTLNFTMQPNNMVTTSGQVQEQFEVEKFPEIGYHRIGESIADDQLTFFSDNSLSAMQFHRTGATLREQGYTPGFKPYLGLPSEGVVGSGFRPAVPGDPTYRGDFRQEIDYPITAGQFKIVPYVLGRHTAYSASPSFGPAGSRIGHYGGEKNRILGGTGVRMTTAFWAVDDSVQSALFDLNRLRHVVEPEVHLFTSAQSTDRNELFIYDEDVDGVNDITAAQIALHQRWQTKRGGPGRWRSVDFFTLNVEGDFFSNEPPDNELRPNAFRGLFFDSIPEASIPRDAINADATWRLSDTTVMLSDAQYNIDHATLATASVGLAVRRDPRVSYSVGNRFINELNSNITSFGVIYDLSTRYSLSFSQSYDFAQGDTVGSNLEIVRKFDSFFGILRFFYDERADESGFSFTLIPKGLNAGIGSDTLGTPRQ